MLQIVYNVWGNVRLKVTKLCMIRGKFSELIELCGLGSPRYNLQSNKIYDSYFATHTRVENI